MKKLNIQLKSLSKRVSGGIQNRQGNSIIASIVISAIVLIALVLLKDPISTFIDGMWGTFSDFIDNKLDNIFKS